MSEPKHFTDFYSSHLICLAWGSALSGHLKFLGSNTIRFPSLAWSFIATPHTGQVTVSSITKIYLQYKHYLNSTQGTLVFGLCLHFFSPFSKALHGSEKCNFVKITTQMGHFKLSRGVKLVWVCANPTSENQLAAL